MYEFGHAQHVRVRYFRPVQFAGQSSLRDPLMQCLQSLFNLQLASFRGLQAKLLEEINAKCQRFALESAVGQAVDLNARCINQLQWKTCAVFN